MMVGAPAGTVAVLEGVGVVTAVEGTDTYDGASWLDTGAAAPDLPSLPRWTRTTPPAITNITATPRARSKFLFDGAEAARGAVWRGGA